MSTTIVRQPSPLADAHQTNMSSKYVLDTSEEAYADPTIIHWAYTVNIYPEKRLPAKIADMTIDEYQWNECSDEIQKKILLKSLELCKRGKDLELHHIFEKCKSGAMHIHGHFYSTKKMAIYVQDFFHRKFGLPKAPHNRCCYIEPTLVKESYWHKYEEKEQSLFT